MSVSCLAPCLLDDECHRIAFIYKTQLTGGHGTVGWIHEDPTVVERSMYVGDHCSNVAQGVRTHSIVRRTEQVRDVVAHALRPLVRITTVHGVDLSA